MANRFIVTLALVVAFAPSGICLAVEGDGQDRLVVLDRMTFLQRLAQAPQVHAAQAQVRAAVADARVSARLPDPTVEAGYDRSLRPTSAEPMLTGTLQQVIPRWGERLAQHGRATAVVAVISADLSAVAGDAAASAATAIAERSGAQARLVVVDQRIERIETQEREIRLRIAAGRASAMDLLDLQARLADARLDHDGQTRTAADAESEVRRLLGLADETPLPPFSAPAIPAVAPDGTPDVQRARAEAAVAQAEREVAHAGRFPETTLGVRVGRTLGDDADTTVGMTVGISLPLWPARPLAAEDAARERVLAARSAALAAGARSRADLARALRAARLADAARATADAVQGAADAQVQTLRAAAGAGDRATIGQILDALERVDAARERAIDAEVSAQTARADLWRLLPPSADELNSSGVGP